MDVWTDIQALNPVANERVGYPTQKPLELHERIVKASSNPDDIMLAPFASCATTLVVAEKLGRQWIDIDISEGAHDLVETRLADTTGLFGKVHFETDPPVRTDDGETASPHLRVKVRVKEPGGKRWARAEMYDHLLEQKRSVCQGCVGKIGNGVLCCEQASGLSHA